MPWRCRVFGHDYDFRAHGATMAWSCGRGCAAGGSKTYGTAQEARHYAAAFDRRDRDQVGRRAPFLGLFPLRLWRRMTRGRSG